MSSLRSTTQSRSMDPQSRGSASTVTAPLIAGGIATAGTLRLAAHRMDRTSETPACLGAVEGATSRVDTRRTLKAFGPVQQHGGSNSSAGCRFASGLPARRRLLSRRYQQQQQSRDQSEMTSNTAPGCAAGSRSTESSSGGTSPRRKRPTIKDLLGVNPADILMPLLSPPQKAADKETIHNATQGTSTTDGVSPLAFFSVQGSPQPEFQQEKPSVRQKPSAFSSFLARLLPRGSDESTGAGEPAANIQEDSKEHQKTQQQDNRAHAAAPVHAPAGVEEEATRPPPGIIIRSNAPLVPAFNASEGDQPVWKPIVYESKPIYLLPDGSVSNTANNTQATINTASLWNGTQAGGTLSGCPGTTAASCVLPSANVPAAGSAPPTVQYGRGVMHVPPGLGFGVNRGSVDEAGDGLQQPPTPLTASSLPGEDYPRDQNGVPLTNYQKYLQWKEQRHKQQLLYQQLRLQQQQHFTSQWIKTIENLVLQVQPRGNNGPSTSNIAQNPATHAAALGQKYQEQPFYLQQQQQQQLVNSQQQPFDAQQQHHNLVEEQQQQQFALQQQLVTSQQRPLDSQRQIFDSHGCHQHQTFDPQQQLQILTAEQQQQQTENQQGLSVGQEQYQQQDGEQQQLQESRLQNVPAMTGQGQQDTTFPNWLDQPHMQSFQEQQRFAEDAQPLGGSWQELQQWGRRQNTLQPRSQGEGGYCEEAAPSLHHLHLKGQTTQNKYSPQTTAPDYPVGSDTGGPVAEEHASPGILWASARSDTWNPDASNYVDEESAGRAAATAATVAGQHLLQAPEVNPVPNFFPQPAYSPQPPPFTHAMRPLPGAPFHPGFNYAEGISVHYNYYDAEEWTAKLQAAAAAATQREYSGSTQAGGEQEVPRFASEASLSVNSEGENAADLGLKPLLTSKQRLPSGQVFAR